MRGKRRRKKENGRQIEGERETEGRRVEERGRAWLVYKMMGEVRRHED